MAWLFKQHLENAQNRNNIQLRLKGCDKDGLEVEITQLQVLISTSQIVLPALLLIVSLALGAHLIAIPSLMQSGYNRHNLLNVPTKKLQHCSSCHLLSLYPTLPQLPSSAYSASQLDLCAVISFMHL